MGVNYRFRVDVNFKKEKKIDFGCNYVINFIIVSVNMLVDI